MENGALITIMIGLMIAAILVVFAGLGVMVKGGKINEKYGNSLMRWRIALQAAALAAFIAYFLMR